MKAKSWHNNTRKVLKTATRSEKYQYKFAESSLTPYMMETLYATDAHDEKAEQRILEINDAIATRAIDLARKTLKGIDLVLFNMLMGGTATQCEMSAATGIGQSHITYTINRFVKKLRSACYADPYFTMLVNSL